MTVLVPAIVLVGGMLSAGSAGASAGVNGDNWPGSEHLTTTGHLLHAGGPLSTTKDYTLRFIQVWAGRLW